MRTTLKSATLIVSAATVEKRRFAIMAMVPPVPGLFEPGVAAHMACDQKLHNCEIFSNLCVICNHTFYQILAHMKTPGTKAGRFDSTLRAKCQKMRVAVSAGAASSSSSWVSSLSKVSDAPAISSAVQYSPT